jgi:hypothetical protein
MERNLDFQPTMHLGRRDFGKPVPAGKKKSSWKPAIFWTSVVLAGIVISVTQIANNKKQTSAAEKQGNVLTIPAIAIK